MIRYDSACLARGWLGAFIYRFLCRRNCELRVFCKTTMSIDLTKSISLAINTRFERQNDSRCQSKRGRRSSSFTQYIVRFKAITENRERRDTVDSILTQKFLPKLIVRKIILNRSLKRFQPSRYVNWKLFNVFPFHTSILINSGIIIICSLTEVRLVNLRSTPYFEQCNWELI